MITARVGVVLAAALFLAGCGGAASSTGGAASGPAGSQGGKRPAVTATQPSSIAWSAVEAKGPGERYAMQMVWDSSAGRVLLFGGNRTLYKDGQLGGFTAFSDTWAFDPAAGTWTNLSAPGPTQRHFYGACYDTKRNGMWLHGGFSGINHNVLDDLWFFDSAKNAWSEVKPVGPAPAARNNHCLFYDAAGDQLILMLGLVEPRKIAMSNEVWAFDIKTSKWSKRASGPSARFQALGAMDPAARRAWIVGGVAERGELLSSGEAWSYDIAADKWAKETEVHIPNLTSGAMVFVPASGSLLIMGGLSNHTEYWRWGPTGKWQSGATAEAMPGRSFNAMTIDPKTNRVFVYGGTESGMAAPCVPGTMWVGQLR